DQRDHGQGGVPRTLPHRQRLRGGRLQARRIREIPAGGPQGGGRAGRHVGRQARRVIMALNYDAIMAYRPGDIPAAYGARDCILYALGIGLGMDPMDEGQLRFVYEKNLLAFPTLATTLGWMGRLTDPKFGIDERLVVLADQRVVLHRPLPPEASLISRPHVKEIIDKGEGNAAIIQSVRDLTTQDGTLVATVESSALARKHGGFGG